MIASASIRLNLSLSLVTLLGLSATSVAQNMHLGFTYTGPGKDIYVNSCDRRDLSGSRPDKPVRPGLDSVTNETRGAVKKLLATCKQPTAQEVAESDHQIEAGPAVVFRARTSNFTRVEGFQFLLVARF